MNKPVNISLIVLGHFQYLVFTFDYMNGVCHCFQGTIDPEVKAALLRIIDLRCSESDL